jgi:hypothetical protein
MTDTTTEYGDFTPINVASSTKLMLELSEPELTMKNASDTLRALAAEHDTLTARVKQLEDALGDVSQSTGCCDVCSCHMRATRKARALTQKDKTDD